MVSIDINVDFSAEHETVALADGRPALTWGRHPAHGYGWTLWHLEDPTSETSGIDDHFIPGDLTEVDDVVERARAWLASMGG